MIARVVSFFLTGPFSGLLIAASLLLGVAALTATPREEDPQIIVPMADVEVAFPGHSPKEVEQLVTRPLEKILWQLDGIEHVYSQSERDGAVVTARFLVGEEPELAMVRLRDKVYENIDIIPEGVAAWRVIPVSIDDVPIVTLTLTSDIYTPAELRRVAEELSAALDAIADISKTDIIGGYPRTVRVEPDLAAMAAYGLSLPDLEQAVRRTNAAATVGHITMDNRRTVLVADPDINDTGTLAKTVVKTEQGRIVRLGDVAAVTDGAEYPEYYVRHMGKDAVTLAFSKKKGVNAVTLSKEIITRAGAAKGNIIPDGVILTVTRDQGEAANERVNDLISGMVFAVITVILVIAVFMGWRESLVVGLSVPVSFALALFVNYLAGYTLNRVTLFALILSLGLIVDDPIINVDNIQRHIRMGGKNTFDATLDAVKEVVPPVIISTIGVIMSFVPMFFITGMMGPYMAPMAINVPLTVVFSTLCALTFVPALARRLLAHRQGSQRSEEDVTPQWISRFYSGIIRRFFIRRNAVLLLVVMAGLVIGSAALMVFTVPLKMLPFDNRNELQLIVNMPPESSLEHTVRLVTELENYVSRQNEVTNYQSYIGIASPIDFNGLVRHYGLRAKPGQADIRINLLPKNRRSMSSHAIALRVRDDITGIAKNYGAMVNIVETPPGPPVLASIVAEVYGQPGADYATVLAGAEEVKKRLGQTDARHAAELDFWQQPSPPRQKFVIDTDKAAMNGLSAAEITTYLKAAISGTALGDLRVENERQPLHINMRLGYKERNDWSLLETLNFRGSSGAVPLGELGDIHSLNAEWPVMHKNMQPVVMVTSEAAGRPPGELILDTMFKTIPANPLPEGIHVEWAGEGEWEVTLRVFRDLGIAFGVALVGIFLMLIVQTRSMQLSLVMLCAIPLTLIGIAPGFWLLNLIGADTVGGYSNPVFFTATGMIGMIALGGIVIRNSVVLIDFIEDARAKGMDRYAAVEASGAVRFRPIMLTALTALLAAWPITLDPIFSGLAWALIFGLSASTIFTLVVIPTIYILIDKKQEAAS